MVESDIIELYRKLKECRNDMKSYPKHSLEYVKARHAYSIISYRLNVQYGKFGDFKNVPPHSKP